jgi:hypothetical protein
MRPRLPSEYLNPIYFWTPDTPDLGCFVRSDHVFQVDSPNFHLWAEPPPYDQNFNYLPHQVYVRVKCGEAAFFQRCHVRMRNTWDPNLVLALPPDWTLGGDYPPYPSDWQKYPPQPGPQVYWFAGEYRNPSQAAWQRDTAVGHSYDIYDNGTLSTVGWDDTGGDRDMDDLIVEVAVVYRRSYFDRFQPVDVLEADVDAFFRDVLPSYQGHAEGAELPRLRAAALRASALPSVPPATVTGHG